jgi:hypothetical protein
VRDRAGARCRFLPMKMPLTSPSKSWRAPIKPWRLPRVEGVEAAADPPERPVHTHEEYGRPDDAPPKRNRDAA